VLVLQSMATRKKPFCELVASARIAKNWTQLQLAQELGCSVGTVRAIEGGFLSPKKPGYADKAAATLGIAIDEVQT
jgi:transcriptional regulator with XRE-family HTH domain